MVTGTQRLAKGDSVKAVVTKRQKVITRDMFEITCRAAVGLALFVLVMAALSYSAHAQEIPADQRPNGSKPTSVSAITSSGSAPKKTISVEPEPSISSKNESPQSQATPSPTPEAQRSDPPSKWHYGGFVDVGYLLDFNHPENR